KYACSTYMGGLKDGFDLMKFFIYADAAPIDFPHTGPGSCAPSGVTNGQYYDVLKAYISNHPENRQVGLDILALTEWAEPWPCKKHANLTTFNQCPKPPVILPPKEFCLANLCMHWKQDQ